MVTRINHHFSYVFPVFITVLLLLFPLNSSALHVKKSKHTVKKVWYSYDTVKIYIKPGSSGRVPQHKYKMLDNNRFYIDIFDSVVEKNLDSVIDLDDVIKLRRAQFDRNVSRVVIYFNKKGIHPSVRYVNGSSPYFLISWKGSSTSYSGKKYRILIDPGHGGTDNGATGNVLKLKEKIVTLDIALKLEKLLKERKEKDVIVELTRRTDITLSTYDRRDIANKWKPDLFISIHANSNRDRDQNGTEIYYRDNNSKDFALTVLDELLDELNRSESDGDIRNGRFVVLNNKAKYGSVLVESCYISCERGEKRLNQDKYRNEIAKGLNTSIDTFLRKLSSNNE